MPTAPVPDVETLPTRPQEQAAPVGRMALVALAALAAGIGLVWGLGRDASPTFGGSLVVRTTQVTAERAGMLTEHLVRPGERVTLGTPLVSLADSELQTRIAVQREALLMLRSQVTQAEAQADVELAWRMKELDDQLLDTQLRSADFLKEKFDYELQKSMWADLLSGQQTVMFGQGDGVYESIVLKNHIPSQQRIDAVMRVESAANAIDVAAAQVEICEARLQQLRGLKAELPARIREKSGVSVAGERLAQAQAELARCEAQQSGLTITSPAVGAVGVFRKQAGDHVLPGDAIVELLDDVQRWIVVDVPSAQIRDFTIGRKLDLVFPGADRRTGKVFSIAPQAQPRVPGTSPALGDALIAVHVEPCGKTWPELPIGSQVEVRLAP
jgi:multidrug resistance efflux pump